jgi:hypothetical protein
MTPETNYASPAAGPSAQPTADIAPKNFISRLVGVYFSPGETFKEIGFAPRPLMPILALVALGLIVGLVMTTRLDVAAMLSQQFSQQVADGKMTQEQAAQALPFAMNMVRINIFVFGALATLVISLAVAGVFKLVSLALGAENTYRQLLAVTVYSFLAVTIVSSLIFILLLFLKPTDELTFENLGNVVGSNLGALLTMVMGEKALPKFVTALASRVDVFSIWIIALLSIGYAAVSRRLKTGTAATALGVLYGVYAVIASAASSVFGR